jgi:hypothetical protein
MIIITGAVVISPQHPIVLMTSRTDSYMYIENMRGLAEKRMTARYTTSQSAAHVLEGPRFTDTTVTDRKR